MQNSLNCLFASLGASTPALFDDKYILHYTYSFSIAVISHLLRGLLISTILMIFLRIYQLSLSEKHLNTASSAEYTAITREIKRARTKCGLS